ncbi:glutamyl-tRNA(Gln) amidotransferase subunit HER2 Ecym_4768 [Eremothecium cymbalariae DBVPG|uniref:Glutamyl-tRNA(Gln) amidotransferase subunit A, mitochondrial n=1 Tax=Eremothecium cymbalariae (strain CBS 270.75 / DBVPG 7215 / KCTC 17166 / NRRL Y-17582) TaxID=931890 RepID=G8JSQ8_ERECY|nr:hypothetical protein Ecym_4768 [Eremothecium cymbalariae DBVPG\
MSIRGSLYKLSKIDHLQEKFNIFTSINQNIKNELQPCDKPLANLLVGIKDNIVTKDLPTTCASGILEGYKSPFDATVVTLLKDAGVVVIGKTNMDEFGMGSGGTHSKFGVTYNPMFLDEKVVVGGSSSGSAAAVASDVVDFALGTDTGGSVRIPAAYTSTFGFKPSYGRLSRFGVIAYAQSLDTVGIITKDIEMIKKVFRVLDKYDAKDPTSLTDDLRSKAPSLASKTKNQLKIGIPQEFMLQNISKQVNSVLMTVIDKILEQGHEICPVSIPMIKYSLPIYYTLAPAEAASNLSRYDGIRYGYRDTEKDIYEDTLFVPTRANFGKEVKNRILLGNYNLCSGAFRNNFLKAQKLRNQLINEFDNVFSVPNILTNNKPKDDGVDLLLSLSCMTPPPTVNNFMEQDAKTPVNSYINDSFTIPMSLAGLPCISIPVKNNVGIGVQLTGQFADDECVLDAAQRFT